MRHAAQHPWRTKHATLPVTPAASSHTARRGQVYCPDDVIDGERTYRIPTYSKVLVVGRGSDDDPARAAAVEELMKRRKREA